MKWTEYIQLSYKADLALLAKSVGRSGDRLEFCECEIESVQDKVAEASFEDPTRLVILAFWDALLLAAVHCYDPSNYCAYRSAVPQAPFIKSHSGTGTHLPHLLLALTPWNETTRSLLEESGSLLTVWADAYDRTVAERPGSGLRILQALIDDRSLTINPYNKLEPGVLSVLGNTLRQAVACV